ncbi:unnamed protein product, partial [Iphiclides podalirius]
MQERILFATIILAVFYTAYVRSVPFITKCKSDDSKCAKESAQAAITMFAAGLPEYGVKTLDPVTFQKIDASSPNLKLILTDITVTGLKNCIFQEVKRDKPKSKLYLKLQCSGVLDGQYEMKGQLLILKIEGKGPIHVNLRKAEISVDIDLEEQNDKWNIKQWKHSYELKDNSEVVFGNLLDGNEELKKPVEEVIANNGNEIILEVGQPVVKTIVDEMVSEVNKFFHAVSAKELSID